MRYLFVGKFCSKLCDSPRRTNERVSCISCKFLWFGLTVTWFTWLNGLSFSTNWNRRLPGSAFLWSEFRKLFIRFRGHRLRDITGVRPSHMYRSSEPYADRTGSTTTTNNFLNFLLTFSTLLQSRKIFVFKLFSWCIDRVPLPVRHSKNKLNEVYNIILYKVGSRQQVRRTENTVSIHKNSCHKYESCEKKNTW